MKIVFFAHPLFLGSHSMSRFATMLSVGMRRRGHETQIWRPEAYFSRLPGKRLQKWFAYIDQYLVFPLLSKSKLRLQKNTLYVFTDHALGPYVPLSSKKPHVIHCHDFLAQRSAQGEILENPTSATGRIYQKYIRQGYSKGKNFISVSERTRTELEAFLITKPDRSEMVYNGLSPDFMALSKSESRAIIGGKWNLDLTDGYILHVGGNQWYKNRPGVLSIYEAWRKKNAGNMPLIFIGEQANCELLEKQQKSAYKDDIYFFSGIDDISVHEAYAGASVFLFPSLAEGFGWPIAEAMASGTLVITTNEAPMTEVAGDAAFLIDRMPFEACEQEKWSKLSAAVLQTALSLTEEELEQRRLMSEKNVKRFDIEETLDHIESIYIQVMNENAALV
jgi:glycosyltransferase involved in cell wall biosynthesis